MERLPDSDYGVNRIMNVQQGTGERVYDIVVHLTNIPLGLAHSICEGICEGICEWFDFIAWPVSRIPHVTQPTYVPWEDPYRPSEF